MEITEQQEGVNDMKKPNGILPNGISPANGVRPPKPGHNYYVCKKCGHRFEAVLPICPECKSLEVSRDTILRH
jgi:rubrerythrin